MEQRNIKQILEDFKRDFQLTDEEVNQIAKPETSGLEERVRKMDRVREAARELSKEPIVLNYLLFLAHERKSSFFDLLVEGYFGKAIANIIRFIAFTAMFPPDEKFIEKLKLRKKGK